MLKNILVRLIIKYYQRLRGFVYKSLSTNTYLGNPTIFQPLQVMGDGSIKFSENIILGYTPSPCFYNGIIYIEARDKDSLIEIGEGTIINNNLILIAERESIIIGKNCLIGHNVEIINSDFHDLDPMRRKAGIPLCKSVIIEDNVFIGANVKILKGLRIGANSVIANSSIVVKDVSENSVYGGNPARYIKNI